MIGAMCKVRGTDIKALCVGKRQYVGDVDRFMVRFLHDGVPHEREFTRDELEFNAAQVAEIRRVA